jgi:hypothetical protein
MLNMELGFKVARLVELDVFQGVRVEEARRCPSNLVSGELTRD